MRFCYRVWVLYILLLLNHQECRARKGQQHKNNNHPSASKGKGAKSNGGMSKGSKGSIDSSSDIACCDSEIAAMVCGTATLATFWQDVVWAGCANIDATVNVYRDYFDEHIKVLGLTDTPVVGFDAMLDVFVNSGLNQLLCETVAQYWVPERAILAAKTFRWFGTENDDGREYVFDCESRKILEIVVV